MRITVALAAALAAIAALAGPRVEPATACSCAGVDPARDLARYDAAFVGTVVAHRAEHPTAPIYGTGDPAYWTFSVERAVKGALPSRLVVKTAVGGASCGLKLEQSDRVGLMLERDGDKYRSGLCSQVDPDHLARYALPGARINGRSSEDHAWPLWLAAVGGGALTVLAFGAIVYRRRRS
jgi:hypothetical protein